MKRLRGCAAGLAAILLSGCQQPESAGPAEASINSVEGEAPASAGSGTAYEDAKGLHPIAKAMAEVQAEPSPRIQRKPSYQPYALATLDGGEWDGRTFEDKIMCKGAWDNADYTVEALKTLVIISTRPGLTSFLGLSQGHRVEIALVSDENTHTPMFLMMGSEIIVTCET
jgi:hypothetical protein